MLEILSLRQLIPEGIQRQLAVAKHEVLNSVDFPLMDPADEQEPRRSQDGALHAERPEKHLPLGAGCKQTAEGGNQAEHCLPTAQIGRFGRVDEIPGVIRWKVGS